MIHSIFQEGGLTPSVCAVYKLLIVFMGRVVRCFINNASHKFG